MLLPHWHWPWAQEHLENRSVLPEHVKTTSNALVAARASRVAAGLVLGEPSLQGLVSIAVLHLGKQDRERTEYMLNSTSWMKDVVEAAQNLVRPYIPQAPDDLIDCRQAPILSADGEIAHRLAARGVSIVLSSSIGTESWTATLVCICSGNRMRLVLRRSERRRGGWVSSLESVNLLRGRQRRTVCR